MQCCVFIHSLSDPRFDYSIRFIALGNNNFYRTIRFEEQAAQTSNLKIC